MCPNGCNKLIENQSQMRMPLSFASLHRHFLLAPSLLALLVVVILLVIVAIINDLNKPVANTLRVALE